MTKYEVSVLGSTGEVIYANHNFVDVRLTDAQKKQAEEFYAETSEWEEKHTEALQSLQLACSDWAKAKLGESRPIVLEANRGEMPGVKQRQFSRSYYVRYAGWTGLFRLDAVAVYAGTGHRRGENKINLRKLLVLRHERKEAWITKMGIPIESQHWALRNRD